MAYLYPPTLKNGKLLSSNDPIKIIQSKIIQTVSIVRGELDSYPDFGTEFTLFNSINNIRVDTVALEALLTQYIPEAIFLVTSEINNSGRLIVTINWEFLGSQQSLSLDLEI